MSHNGHNDQSIADRVERKLTDFGKRFDDMEEKIDRLDHHITGNGTPERGVLIRLDRIEQKAVAQSKVAAYAIGFASAALAGIVVQFVLLAIKAMSSK